MLHINIKLWVFKSISNGSTNPPLIKVRNDICRLVPRLTKQENSSFGQLQGGLSLPCGNAEDVTTWRHASRLNVETLLSWCSDSCYNRTCFGAAMPSARWQSPWPLSTQGIRASTVRIAKVEIMISYRRFAAKTFFGANMDRCKNVGEDERVHSEWPVTHSRIAAMYKGFIALDSCTFYCGR